MSEGKHDSVSWKEPERRAKAWGVEENGGGSQSSETRDAWSGVEETWIVRSWLAWGSIQEF